MEISFELTQTIARPPDEVFAFISDFSNMVYWNYYIQSVERISTGNIMAGSLFKMTRPRDVKVYKIIELTAPQKMVLELQSPPSVHQLIFIIERSGTNTVLSYRWRINADGYPLVRFMPGFLQRLLLFIPRQIMLQKTRPAVEENFKKLKELLENGKTTLQDGRTVFYPASHSLS